MAVVEQMHGHGGKTILNKHRLNLSRCDKFHKARGDSSLHPLCRLSYFLRMFMNRLEHQQFGQ